MQEVLSACLQERRKIPGWSTLEGELIDIDAGHVLWMNTGTSFVEDDTLALYKNPPPHSPMAWTSDGTSRESKVFDNTDSQLKSRDPTCQVSGE